VTFWLGSAPPADSRFPVAVALMARCGILPVELVAAVLDTRVNRVLM
jgi:hypothetical protein